MLLPLKQGLKPPQERIGKVENSCCYATSIKTRIETHLGLVGNSGAHQVVMLLPLKQGLKPI